MNIQRFHASTSREALAKARMAFGDGTLILSNRPTAQGVEVLATAESLLSALDATAASPPPPPPASPAPPRPGRPERNPVAQDTEQLAMSTLSFQDYVRERMLRRRHEAALQSPAPAPPATPTPSGQRREPAPTPRPAASGPMPAPAFEPMPASAVAHPNPPGVAQQLHAMQALIEDRLDTLAWLGQARQHPIQSQLMLKLIRAAYSPTLARALLERMPPDLSAAASVRWLLQALAHNLRTDLAAPPLYEQGGIYALLGATGVGKTTTIAKLAALCARSHGADSVGLITMDGYRPGAHEQLRSHGRMLGIVAHLAHDRAALHDLLGLFCGKKLVLIDTPGLPPRDPRKRELTDLRDLPQVNRLLVLNAGCHGDTLDEMLGAYESGAGAGPPQALQAILSKLDEAAKPGPAIDALIRHRVLLRGLTQGQRVPEDWQRADAQQLVSASMRAPAPSAFDPKASELNFFFSPTPAHGVWHH